MIEYQANDCKYLFDLFSMHLDQVKPYDNLTDWTQDKKIADVGEFSLNLQLQPLQAEQLEDITDDIAYNFERMGFVNGFRMAVELMKECS